MHRDNNLRDFLIGEQELLVELSRQLQAEADRIAANCQVSEEFAFVDPGFLDLFQRSWQEHIRPYTLPLLQRLAEMDQAPDSLLIQALAKLASLEAQLAAARHQYQQGRKDAAWDLSRTLAALADLAGGLARSLGAKLEQISPDPGTPPALGELQAFIPPGPAMAAAQQLVRQLGQKRCCHD